MNDKEMVVDRLDGKTLLDLAQEYWDLEGKILSRAGELPNSLKQCNCSIPERVIFEFIEINVGEIIRICLKCGGDIGR